MYRLCTRLITEITYGFVGVRLQKPKKTYKGVTGKLQGSYREVIGHQAAGNSVAAILILSIFAYSGV
jgi:hypothetical protein